MMPPDRYQLLAQQILNRHGAGLKEDANFGTLSDRAADRINQIALSPARQVALTVQKEHNRHNLDDLIAEDGWWGPDTEEAADAMLGVPAFRRPDEADRPLAQCHDGSCSLVRCWRPSDSEMMRHYGAPGTGQKTVTLPYPMRLDWDLGTIVTRATVHQLVAGSFQAALESARDHYGREAIEDLGLNRTGGTLNVRKKRGGSTWSAHAFGAAKDTFPSANKLRETHRTARFARENYAAWFRCWEAEGWMALGRCYDFDWMHVQKNPW